MKQLTQEIIRSRMIEWRNLKKLHKQAQKRIVAQNRIWSSRLNMRINIKQTLEFFDEKPEYGRGHATGIVGMLGESLNAAVFGHFMESGGAEVRILDISVTTGKMKGKRLDRWIYIKNKGEEVLYQAEIKNSSSWAIGGKILKVSSSKEETYRVAKSSWDHEYTTFWASGDINNVTKVLVEMRVPEGYSNVRVKPLLIYWMPISRDDNLTPFFFIDVTDLRQSIKTQFEVLHIFSVSLYFRSLLERGIYHIDLKLPLVERRLSIVSDILSL